MPNPNPKSLSLTAIGHINVESRWRSEAMRSHSAPRLLYFTKGQGRITIAGLTSGYGANNLIFIPSGTMYGYEIGQTAFGYLLTIPPAMVNDWPDEPVHLRLRDVTVQNEVATAFDRLEKELHSQLLGHARAALYHLGLLSVLFQRQFETAPLAEANSHGHSAAARLVAAFTGQIERDFHTDMGVANYASLLGVTPTHLTRCCNETSGRTALALLNDRKLFEARIRLRGTDMPVRKIAQMLGYSSAAYFTRAFQAGAGMTPTQFRRKGPLPIL